MSDTPEGEVKKPLEYKFYVSSWHCREQTRNYIGVVEKCVKEYPDGHIETQDRLSFNRDPKRPYWLTKPSVQIQYDHKKEFEELDNLELHVCHDSELEDDLARALGYSRSYRRRFLRQLCSSPYVYGADISTETLIKQEYVKNVPVGKVANFSIGGLDIETEVRGAQRITLITYIHEHHIYTAALREYCKIHDNPDSEVSRPATEEDCLKVINDLLGFYFKLHNFELTFKICDTELDIIKWIFEQIHREKTNFIGIWNMGFDLTRILARIEANGAKAEDILCHPDIPKYMQYVKYKEDRSQDLQHFTDRWDWMSIAGYSQFIDSMCLYARLRKVDGRDSSYSLDDISTKELGQGKLHFESITNHWWMTNRRFLEYIAYNVNDVMIMILMEWKNNDMAALAALCGMSTPQDFARQTTMLRNEAFIYGKANRHIPAAAGTTMYDEFDDMQAKAGGTVLPPNKASGTGAAIVEELPGRQTQVGLYANDLDFSSMYPSATSSLNISKETMLLTAIKLNGYPQEMTEAFFSCLIQPELNADYLMKTFWGLPSYTELDDLFGEALANHRLNYEQF